MAAKPEWFLVGFERLFNVRPDLINLGFESSVNLAYGLGHGRQGVGVGANVIPVIDLGSAKYNNTVVIVLKPISCLLYTSPSPRDQRGSRMPSSA